MIKKVMMFIAAALASMMAFAVPPDNTGNRTQEMIVSASSAGSAFQTASPIGAPPTQAWASSHSLKKIAHGKDRVDKRNGAVKQLAKTDGAGLRNSYMLIGKSPGLKLADNWKHFGIGAQSYTIGQGGIGVKFAHGGGSGGITRSHLPGMT